MAIQEERLNGMRNGNVAPYPTYSSNSPPVILKAGNQFRARVGMDVLLNVQYLSLHSDVHVIHMNAADVIPTSFGFVFANGPALTYLESLYARMDPSNLWLADC